MMQRKLFLQPARSTGAMHVRKVTQSPQRWRSCPKAQWTKDMQMNSRKAMRARRGPPLHSVQRMTAPKRCNWQAQGQQQHEKGGAHRLTFLLPGPALGRLRRLAWSRAGYHMPTIEAMRKDNFSESTLFVMRIEELSDPDTRVLRDQAVNEVLHDVTPSLSELRFFRIFHFSCLVSQVSWLLFNGLGSESGAQLASHRLGLRIWDYHRITLKNYQISNHSPGQQKS